MENKKFYTMDQKLRTFALVFCCLEIASCLARAIGLLYGGGPGLMNSFTFTINGKAVTSSLVQLIPLLWVIPLSIKVLLIFLKKTGNSLWGDVVKKSKWNQDLKKYLLDDFLGKRKELLIKYAKETGKKLLKGSALVAALGYSSKQAFIKDLLKKKIPIDQIDEWYNNGFDTSKINCVED